MKEDDVQRTKKTGESERVLGVRCSSEIVSRIEAHTKRLQGEHPAFTISQSDALRDLVRLGLDAAEKK